MLFFGIPSGFKVNDTNGNGVWDAGEAGIQGWKIILKNSTSVAEIANTTTNVDGSYRFKNISNGIYYVSEELKAGWMNTSATSNLVTVDGQDIMNLNFMNKPMIQPVNFIKNPGFESGTTPWIFYTNGKGSFTTVSPGYEGNKAARLTIVSAGNNTQLYQKDLTLEPNTRYRLSFAANSTRGHDLKVKLLKHVSPFTPYGLDQTFNLGTNWQEYSITFTTTGFTSTVKNGRLMFYLVPFAVAGDKYYIDNVRLRKV
ncbi:MAG TPA: carbohydrate binding domain-containing protein [Candidatus Limnocylindrales bacterium]|nr:carbohydrate binding domain-containing protein [Candidatus Limnocylindrales bacterium]